MLKKILIFSPLILLVCCASQGVAEKEKLPQFFGQNIQENIKSVEIKISNSRVFSAKSEITTKGNGTIQLGNLLIRVYDTHDDGIVYKNNELEVYLQDLTGDGNRELILTGVLAFSDDDDSIPIIYLPITEIISLDCQKQKFEILFNQSNYSSVIFDDSEIRVKCS